MYATYVLWLFPFPLDNHLATIHPYYHQKENSCAKTVNIRERNYKKECQNSKHIFVEGHRMNPIICTCDLIFIILGFRVNNKVVLRSILILLLNALPEP